MKNTVMELYLYNTLTRQKEQFKPIVEGVAKIYSCGPTVYSDPHIGNLRAFTVWGLLGDVFRHVLKYNTTHVMNITDVGHLTDDGDAGEDKMEKGARREGLTARDVAKRYEANFLQYLADLHIRFDIHPRATEHIQEQIDIVKMLEDNGYTYIIEGDGVYMDTSKVADYGKLMGPNYKDHIAGLDAGNRVDVEGKKNITDFALWKFNMTGKKRDMERKSPWGVGFPGWHIECSAMSRKYLGDNVDIHTGGVDHIAIHHTDEIAQSECSFAKHKPWVNYWLHNQFLNLAGMKVSKSAGDDLSIPGLRAKGFEPEDLRLFFMTGHYRSFLEFTRENLEAAKTTRANMIKKIYNYMGDRIVTLYDIQREDINDLLYMQLTSGLLDDLDTPKFLASIQKALSNINDEVVKVILYIDTYLLKIGLYEGVVALMKSENIQIPAEIEALAQERWDAKQGKNFEKADELRKAIEEKGWLVKDTKEGFTLTPSQ